jgi:hypothetical protein
MPSTLNIQVRRAGYVDLQQQVLAKPGESAASVRIELTPQAVIFGKLTDEDAFPVADVMVEVQRYRLVDGRMQLGTVGYARSNDRGEFRAANLAAGRYYLRLNTAMGDLSIWDPRYLPQFFPGTLDARDNGVIEVKAGEQHGIEFHVVKQTGSTVAGRVLAPGGQPWTPAAVAGMVNLLPNISIRVNSPTASYTVRSIQAQHDGTFSLPQIPPGTYLMEARVGSDLQALQEIQVGSSDQRDIVLTLRVPKPADLSGTVVLEGNAKPGAYAIGLRAMMGPPLSAISNEDGTFVVKGVLPGHYNVMVSPDMSRISNAAEMMRRGARMPAFGHPVSARYGDREVLQGGFDFDGTSTDSLLIHLVAATAILSGQLLNAGGQPLASGAVLFQGDAPGHRSLIQTQPDGTFQTALPSGKYHVYAVADPGQVQSLDDPAYLKAHDSDFPLLQVAEGKNPSVTLRLAK